MKNNTFKIIFHYMKNEKLGTLGMILAHEVTHGFDSNGSQFDEFGNLNNWWTEEDKMLFEELKESVSAYYSKYEVLTGKYINGKKTVNENIADLGAVLSGKYDTDKLALIITQTGGGCRATNYIAFIRL